MRFRLKCAKCGKVLADWDAAWTPIWSSGKPICCGEGYIEESYNESNP